MKTKKSKMSLRTWLSAVALLASAVVPVQSVFAGSPIPVLQTQDRVSSRVGVFRNGSRFTPDAQGHTGAAGDRAVDFSPTSTGPVYVADGSFFNTAAANDEITVAFWTKRYDVSDSSAFWANSPSSSAGQRGYQAHVPWSNNRIYFDDAGCCAANQRIDAGIDTLPDYQAVGDNTWWTDTWHLFAFSKKGGDKQIWIDGVLFLEQTEGAAPLPTDFTDLYIGSDGAGNASHHGLIDDFMVFSTQLSPDDIAALAAGTAPSALPPSAGLLAHWDFNDIPAAGQFISVLPVPDDTRATPNLVQVVHGDGAAAWTAANVSLKVDGAAVVTTFDKDAATGIATVSYVPSPLFDAGSKHTATLTYPVVGGQATLEWSFVVGNYTLDAVASRLGVFTAGSSFSAGDAGHTGLAGDRSADFPINGSGAVFVRDASFFNTAAENDEVTVAFWGLKYNNSDSSAFWAHSPSSNNGQRGYQAHVPWSNQHIYFDSVGCCGANQRIEALVDGTLVPEYTDATWWNDWHLFVFSKKAGDKQIWIDGGLFLEQAEGAAALPLDFTKLYIGSGADGGSLFHGRIDDFSVFSTQLTVDDIALLMGGTKPTELPPSAGLLAYWSFDDFPAQGVFKTILPLENSTDAAPNLIQVVHLQGANVWDLSKVSLKVDGTTVVADKQSVDGVVTVTYVPNPLLPPGSKHTAALSYPDGAGGSKTRTWDFTVGFYTQDVLHKYLGSLQGAAAFSPDAGGHSGSPGDYAIDFGAVQAGQAVYIADASFLNEAAANDEMAVAGWQKLYSIHDSAFFWGISPSSNGGTRGWGTHAPWSNNNLYFDTSGCCSAGGERISGDIATFQPYIDAGIGQDWWKDWHYIVFQKKLDVKEIWIDGVLFITGSNIEPLPTDFTSAFLGNDPVDANARMQGFLDDIAVFKTALDEATIQDLVAGAAPTSLPPEAGLIAFWNFNDAPVSTVAPKLTITRSGNKLIITWTGGDLQASDNVNGPYMTVDGATSPREITPDQAKRFYRARNP